MLYLFSSSGVVTCANAADGKKLWEKELTTGFYCSPLLVSGRIIVFNMEGVAFDPPKLRLGLRIPDFGG